MPNQTWSRTADIDSSTGMPRIPANLFWRVTAPWWGSDYYGVQLRRKTWFGSWCICSQPVDREKISAAEVLDSAAYLLIHRYEVLKYFGTLRRVQTNLLGDYPPKSLGDRNA